MGRHTIESMATWLHRTAASAWLVAQLVPTCAVAAPESAASASSSARSSSASAAHELSLEALTVASADWGGPGVIGKWCRTLQDDGRHLAYGDLDGDGREDAAIVCTDGADGPAAYVAAILNRSAVATAFGGHWFGIDVHVKALAIESGSIRVTLTPPGTTEQQTVRFELGKKRGSLQLDLKDVPLGAPGSDWLTYQDDQFKFSFRYPRNVLLWTHYTPPAVNRTIKAAGEHPFFIEVYDRTPDDFPKAARDAGSGSCDSIESEGNSYGDDQDVEASAISSGGLSGFRLLARCRDQKTHKYNGASHLVYAFDLAFRGTPHMLTFECPPGAMREKIYGTIIATFQRD